MSQNVLKRTTFLVPDAKQSARFFESVFGWTVWYDNTLAVDERFPPSGAPDQAQAHLVIMDTADNTLGKLGLLQYVDPPFDTGQLLKRTKVRCGESILVVNTPEVDEIYQRALSAGANVITEPVNWTVPAPNGTDTITLRTVSLFTPDGIYMEISSHI
ncbi:MAG: VOC family protein [Pseudomonadota bacterium]